MERLSEERVCIYIMSAPPSLIPAVMVEAGVNYLRTVIDLPGDVAECGVYKGGSAYAFCEALAESKKHIHLFDTFSGMPALNLDGDSHGPGVFGDVNLETVKESLQKFGDMCLFYSGVFSETFPSVSTEQFCFVHVDCDLYQSVKECCEFFYPRMSPGGLILFQDYMSPTCVGAKKAVDSFVADKPDQFHVDRRDWAILKKI